MPGKNQITNDLLDDLDAHKKEIAESRNPQEAVYEFVEKHHEIALDELLDVAEEWMDRE